MQEKNKANETESLLEIARRILKRKKNPKKLSEIIEDVRTSTNHSKEEMDALAPQFILDFMCSGYFWYCGDDKYDLKERISFKQLDSDDFKVSDREEEQESEQNDLANAQATVDEEGNVIYENIKPLDKTDEDASDNEKTNEEIDIEEKLRNNM